MEGMGEGRSESGCVIWRISSIYWRKISGNLGGILQRLIVLRAIFKKKIMSEELEIRLKDFAKGVRDFCAKTNPSIINIEYIKQRIRSSGSVAANYIEASDDLGKLDEKMKIKIARRETKESLYWMEMILVYEDKNLAEQREKLIDEGTQIKKILSAILLKLK